MKAWGVGFFSFSKTSLPTVLQEKGRKNSLWALTRQRNSSGIWALLQEYGSPFTFPVTPFHFCSHSSLSLSLSPLPLRIFFFSLPVFKIPVYLRYLSMDLLVPLGENILGLIIFKEHYYTTQNHKKNAQKITSCDRYKDVACVIYKTVAL